MNIYEEVAAERARQETLKATGRFLCTCADPIPDAARLAILVEEVGEVGRAVVELGGLATDRHNKNLRQELIQVCAVAVAWIEGLDKP